MNSTQPSIMLIPYFFEDPNTEDQWIVIDGRTVHSELDNFTLGVANGTFLTLSAEAPFEKLDNSYTTTSVVYVYNGSGLVDSSGDPVPQGALTPMVTYEIRSSTSGVVICASRPDAIRNRIIYGGTGNLKGKINVNAGDVVPLPLAG